MHVIFPNADNYRVPRALFIAAWKVWFKRFGDDADAWREGKLPQRADDLTLHQLLEQGGRFSVELLCRLMVPWSYRDQVQMGEAFFELNPGVIRAIDCLEPETGNYIPCARLTDQALDWWDALAYIEQDIYLSFAEARVQADIESPSNDPLVIDDAGIVMIGDDIYPPQVPDKNASDEEFIDAMVAWIHEDPFTPHYQRQPVGDAVSGWDDRLRAFFWPKPRTGYREYSFMAGPLLYRATELAKVLEAGESWNYEQKQTAVKTANEIFQLAGVPQREVTWQNVASAMQAALNADEKAVAKMNSGWTSLASFATAHLEEREGRLPMVSYNSRVATSIISRLDFLLVESGHDTLGERFRDIGLIPGWGGTRPREFTLQWPDGYRNWKTQIAASRLVNRIVATLNTATDEQGNKRYPPMPHSTGGTSRWTVRGVQLVLFLDGY